MFRFALIIVTEVGSASPLFCCFTLYRLPFADVYYRKSFIYRIYTEHYGFAD